MSEVNFSRPQRQSLVGLGLIFTRSLYAILRNFWFIAFYFLVGKVDQYMLFWMGVAVFFILLLCLGYSIMSYLKFVFYIDQDNREFVLRKGVFSTDVVTIPFQKIQQVNFKRSILQRIAGVYSVVIDTAGSQEEEVEIRALSFERANALADRLSNFKEMEQGEGAEEKLSRQEETPPLQWHYKVPFIVLLKLGITSNYLRGVGVIVAFYVSIREQLSISPELPPELLDSQFVLMFGKIGLILLLVMLSILITVGETLIRYYGLDLQKREDQLQVEMGLRNNTRVSISSRRVQLLKIYSNVIQRKIDLYRTRISLASSQDDRKKSQIRMAGLSGEVIEKLQEFSFGRTVQEEFSMRPSKVLLYRNLGRSMIPAILVLTMYLVGDPVFSFYWLALGILVYVLTIVLYLVLWFASQRLGVSGDFLIRHSGVWTKRTEIVEIFRLQSVSIETPLWYRKKGLVNLTVHSAGGDITFKLLQQRQVRPLMNYVLYRIESTEKPWM